VVYIGRSGVVQIGRSRVVYIGRSRVVQYNPIRDTGHLRKNDGRRPGLDDLKGNNFLAYDLKVAIGVYNEAKRRCRSGATRTTWTKPAGPSLRPTS